MDDTYYKRQFNLIKLNAKKIKPIENFIWKHTANYKIYL